jgi:hypothetical protein
MLKLSVVSNTVTCENPDLLVCDAMSLSEWFPTFLRLMMPSSPLGRPRYRW